NAYIKWSRADGLPLQRYAEGNVLRITNARLQDSGKYKCEIQGHDSFRGSDYVKLNVERASRNPEIIIEQTSPANDRSIMQGDSVDLECKPSVNVNVTWTKLGGSIAMNVLINDKLLR
ncbi:basement membrane-specific heparan sulfate proteoglycan core protein-like, partial [Diaphorina citri]